MDEQQRRLDILDIMQSDMKLWEAADREQVGGNLVLKIILPWGIGETLVTMEGMDDQKRR